MHDDLQMRLGDAKQRMFKCAYVRLTWRLNSVQRDECVYSKEAYYSKVSGHVYMCALNGS